MASAFEKILNIAENFVQLRIVTVVGDFNVSTNNNKITVDATADQSTKALESLINLASGDIINKFDREFVSGELTDMRTFHEQQVGKGQQIVSDNIQALKDLADLIAKILNEQKNEQ